MLLRLANALMQRTFWSVLLAAVVAGGGAHLGELDIPLENRLDEARNAIGPKRVSGDIVVVEIDARSLAEIQAWPWPRSIHGRMVDRLREADARQIVFDIDFSSPATDPGQDRAFAAAMARARGRVILPALLENANEAFGERMEALPAPLLRPHARIGSIWLNLDDDLVARNLPYSVEILGERRPSLAAFLAGRPSPRSGTVRIDWAYDRTSFETISYSDVLVGRFPAGFFARKNVIIGATSSTLGDRFTVPNHGRIPGVFIQATAAETIRPGEPIELGPWPAMLLTCLALALAVRARRWPTRLAGLAATGMAIVVVPFALERTTLVMLDTACALIGFGAGLAALGLLNLTAIISARLTLAPGTCLPNLVSMAASPRHFGSTVAVRLRNYLEIGALLGHEAKSELMRKVHDRLSLASGGSTVFQVDEHSFAWRTAAPLPETIETIEGLSALFNGGIAVADRVVDVMISVGICGEEGLNVETAVAAALLAADRAVRRGTSWSRYEPGADDEKWRISLVAELDRAMESGDVWVAYQPKISLSSGAVTGAEALVRWTHPSQGEIRPELFIPILEEHEQIEKLTCHVLRTAIRDFAALPAGLGVSVNISMRMIGRDLVSPVRRLLDEFGFDPKRLTLEITESAALSDVSDIEELREIRRLGANISIDDYGTGQSTLTYLKTLPATELKIDRSFVQLIDSQRSEATMVDSTIKLAHALDLQVVAEGVENAEIAAKLKAMECDFAQGYHFGRPAPIAEFKARLACSDVAGIGELPARLAS
jgi:EAL domain-containing protein (putative c-di-GMP-specific phosphodiesterase class I)/CHASE2 domain-containing sensor protein